MEISLNFLSMRKIDKFLAFAFAAVMLVSCSKDVVEVPAAGEADQTASKKALGYGEYCGSDTLTLWAGQTIDAGTLIVSNDETNLYVTYTTTGKFGTLHLWVGTDFSLLPMNSQGTPVPGQFPYVVDATGLTTYMFVIPLANISFYSQCGDIIYVVAHAEVTINGNNETAFGGDIEGTGTNRWYYYTEYVTACCSDNPPPVSYEKLGTAFAKGGYVFTTDKKSNPENLPSLNLTKNRWGWAINLTAPATETYDLYVGAGLNRTSKGILVGTATVDFTGTQATVTYNLSTGYSIEEAHVYAGDLVPVTLAPGQYGNTFYFDPFVSTWSFTVDVEDTDGDGVWFIIHAVANGPAVANV